MDIKKTPIQQAIAALIQTRQAISFDPEKDAHANQSEALTCYKNYYQLARFDTQSRHGYGFLAVGEEAIATQYWLPENPIASLYVLHGYYDHVGLFSHAIEFGLKQNYAVIAFDLPGHGLSSGEPAVVDDFLTYSHALDAVIEASKKLQLSGPKFAFAQSTGCAVLLKNQFDKKQTGVEESFFSAQVLLAPLVRPHGWRFGQGFHLLLKPIVSHLKREFAINSHDENFLTFLRSDPLQSHILSVRWVTAMKAWLTQITDSEDQIFNIPTLIVQGKEDTTVDWRFNISLLEKKLKDLTLLWIEDGRHQLINETDAIRDKYMLKAAAFLQEKIN